MIFKTSSKNIGLIFLIIFLAGCSDQNPKPSIEIFSDNIMTIDYRIIIGEKLSSGQRTKIQAIIRNTFAEIDLIYNKWNPQSEISQLNQLPAGKKQTLSPALYDFFNRIDIYVNLSEGRFDPTIEPLQQLWKNHLKQGREPSEEEIIQLKPAIGWDKINFSTGEFMKSDSRTMLDFGGIAKGYCVDLLVERLNREGFLNVFVEWGGEIRASGYHPEGRPWTIFISKSGDPDPTRAIAQLELIDQAIATSGDYYQYWTIDLPQGKTKTYCHIINPLLLTPLEIKSGTVSSASLTANDCLTADTLAKVLMLFDSSEEALEWMKQVQSKHPEMACWIVTH